MNLLEQFLSDFYKDEYCCITSNGTTAMYLLFQALGMQNKIVLYPAISCTNPVNAAVYAGYSVGFCDVNLNDYTMDFGVLEEILRYRNDIGVVVPTHIYGHLYDREKAKFLCERYNVFLFEDAAQTTTIGRADASIVSFGHTKIFEVGLGGAVFVRDEALYEKMMVERGKLEINQRVLLEEAFDKYRELYYAIVNNQSDKKEEKYKKLHKLQLDAKQYFIFDSTVPQEAVMAKLQTKEEIVQNRIEKALCYKEKLNKKFIHLPRVDYSAQSVWRFTFLVSGRRDELLIRVREQNIDISSWYLPLNKIYESGQSCPHAEYISDHVVNLWVDGTHSLSQIEDEIAIINKSMEDLS